MWRKKQFYGAVSGTVKPKYGKLLLMLMFVILIFIGIESGQEIWREYKIKKEIETLKTEITKYKKENNDLEKMLDYYKTLSYKEKEARLKLNMQKPGEKVILVDSAESGETDKKTDNSILQTEENAADFSNVKKWWNYFFGKK